MESHEVTAPRAAGPSGRTPRRFTPSTFANTNPAGTMLTEVVNQITIPAPTASPAGTPNSSVSAEIVPTCAPPPTPGKLHNPSHHTEPHQNQRLRHRKPMHRLRKSPHRQHIRKRDPRPNRHTQPTHRQKLSPAHNHIEPIPKRQNLLGDTKPRPLGNPSNHLPQSPSHRSAGHPHHHHKHHQNQCQQSNRHPHPPEIFMMRQIPQRRRKQQISGEDQRKSSQVENPFHRHHRNLRSKRQPRPPSHQQRPESTPQSAQKSPAR